MTTAANKPTADILADLATGGPDRWWDVTLVKNRVKDPIKVTLMESQKPGTKALSSAIGFGFCIASPAAVREAAEKIVISVGDYAKVIGQFDTIRTK